MSANSTPSKKMTEQSTSPTSPDTSVLANMIAIMASALSNMIGAGENTEESYLDVKPPRSLILEESPDNSPDNTIITQDRSLTLHDAKMVSTPIDGLKLNTIPNAMFDESPIPVKFEVDDSPSGSQEGLDKLGVSVSNLSIDG